MKRGVLSYVSFYTLMFSLILIFTSGSRRVSWTTPHSNRTPPCTSGRTTTPPITRTPQCTGRTTTRPYTRTPQCTGRTTTRPHQNITTYLVVVVLSLSMLAILKYNFVNATKPLNFANFISFILPIIIIIMLFPFSKIKNYILFINY